MLAPVKTAVLYLQAGMVWYASSDRCPNERDMLFGGQGNLDSCASRRLIHLDGAEVGTGVEMRDTHSLFVALCELIGSPK